MERQNEVSRLLSEGLLLFVLAVLLDVAHMVLMALVSGYPQSNVLGLLIFWIPPIVLVFIPIRTYVLLRSAPLTAVAVLVAAVGAVIAIYLTLASAYMIIGVNKNLTSSGRGIPDSSVARSVSPGSPLPPSATGGR